jgi:hypothetical protein
MLATFLKIRRIIRHFLYLKAQQETNLACPSSILTQVQASVLQILTVLSPEVEATSLPEVENRTDMTELPCPASVLKSGNRIYKTS